MDEKEINEGEKNESSSLCKVSGPSPSVFVLFSCHKYPDCPHISINEIQGHLFHMGSILIRVWWII